MLATNGSNECTECDSHLVSVLERTTDPLEGGHGSPARLDAA